MKSRKARLDPLVGQLRTWGELPSDADLDWMEGAAQRHTGGFEEWWKQNRDKLSGRDWMRIFITTWEVGRGAKLPNKRLERGNDELEFSQVLEAVGQYGSHGA